MNDSSKYTHIQIYIIVFYIDCLFHTTKVNIKSKIEKLKVHTKSIYRSTYPAHICCKFHFFSKNCKNNQKKNSNNIYNSTALTQSQKHISFLFPFYSFIFSSVYLPFEYLNICISKM